MLAELDATQDANAPVLTQSYLWGLDLSGTFDQAGGIGGLLAISNHQSQIASHLVCSDANGNVTALVNAGSGQPSARYDYAPFGELLRASGEAASPNPFRFSSKYADAETGLLYHGYRCYSPSTGKWISRDPLEEQGGLNLYTFVANDPVNKIDPYGLLGVMDTSTASEEGASVDAGAGAGTAAMKNRLIDKLIDAICVSALIAQQITSDDEDGVDAYVVRAGIAEADSLMAGSTPITINGQPLPGVRGFSVQSERGKSIEELAKAGQFRHKRISVTTENTLLAVGRILRFPIKVVKTPDSGPGYHCDVTVPVENDKKFFDKLSKPWDRMANPHPLIGN